MHGQRPVQNVLSHHKVRDKRGKEKKKQEGKADRKAVITSKHKILHKQKTKQEIVPEVSIKSLNDGLDDMEDYPEYPEGICGRIQYTLRYSIVSSNYFTGGILVVICINCISLSLQNPPIDNERAMEILDMADVIFLAFFTVEMVLKMAAYGFFRITPIKSEKDRTHKSQKIIRGLSAAEYKLEWGYFRSAWNILDFIVVVNGIVSLSLGNSSSLTVLRAVRLLRPLRAIQRVPRLRIIIQSVVQALPAAIRVGFVLLFLLLIFAGIAVSLFSGRLQSRCQILTSNGWEIPDSSLLDRPCATSKGGFFKCPSGLTCRNIGQNPLFGTISFDNIFDAFYSLFWVSTLTTWDPVMYATMDAVSPASAVFFILFVICISFFATNLVLAVIADNYGELVEEFQHDQSHQDFLKWEGELKGVKRIIKIAGNVLLSEEALNIRQGINEEYMHMTAELPVSETKNIPISDEFIRVELMGNTRLRHLRKADGDDESVRFRVDSMGGNPIQFDRRRMVSIVDEVLEQQAHKRPSLLQHRKLSFITNRGQSLVTKEDDEVATDLGSPLDQKHGNGSSQVSHGFRPTPKYADGKAVVVDSEMAYEDVKLDINTPRNPERDQVSDLSPQSRRVSQGSPTVAFGFPRSESEYKTSSLGDIKARKMVSSPSSAAQGTLHDLKNSRRDTAQSDATEQPRPRRSQSRKSIYREISSKRSSNMKSLYAVIGHEAKTNERATAQMFDAVSALMCGKKEQSMKDIYGIDIESPQGSVKAKKFALSEYRRKEVRRLSTTKDTTVPRLETKDIHGSWAMLKFRQVEDEAKLRKERFELLASTQLRTELRKEWLDQVWERTKKIAILQSALLEVRRARKPLEEHFSTFPYMKAIYVIVKHPVFNLCISIAIILDIIVSGLNYYGMPDSLDNMRSRISMATTVFFLVELALKVIAMGPSFYITSDFNKLDLVLCLLSVVELSTSSTRALSQIRAIRIFRVFLMMEWFESFRMLLLTVYHSTIQLIYISCLLFLFVFLFTILGASQFAGKLSRLGDRAPRQSFDTFYASFLTVFQMLSGDSWPDVTWALVGVTTKEATLYSASLYVIGTYVIMNIFVSALLSQLGLNNSDHAFHHRAVLYIERKLDECIYTGVTGSSLGFLRPQRSENSSDASSIGTLKAPTSTQLRTNDKKESSPLESLTKKRNLKQEAIELKERIVSTRSTRPARGNNKVTVQVDDTKGKNILIEKELMRQNIQDCYRIMSQILEEHLVDKKKDLDNQIMLRMQYQGMWQRPSHPVGVALMIFPPEHPLRKHVFELVMSYAFEIWMILVVILNCIVLALDDPNSDWENDTFAIMEIVMEVMFTMEVLLKLIAFGGFEPQFGYFRNPWNWPDFIAVFSGWLGIRAAKALRAFRPLRLVARSQGMQVVLTSLFRAFPEITQVTVFCTILVFVLSVFGVNFFKGKFGFCADDIGGGASRDSCSPGRWRNADTNFDNIGRAMLTLFQLGTLSDWNEIMYIAIDAVGPDQTPQKNYNQPAGIFFVVAVIMLGFFMINLFVGALIAAFNENKAITDGAFLMTERQTQWRRMILILRSSQLLGFKVDPPKNYFRRLCFYVCGPGNDLLHPFEIVISTLLVVNTIVVCMQHDGQPEEMVAMEFYVGWIITCAFTLEAFFKVMAWGPQKYFRSNWNKFDFALALTSLITGSLSQSTTVANTVRLLRVLRAFRFVRWFSTLQELFDTLLVSLPAAWNVLSLMLVVFFIFAIIGMYLFGQVARTPRGLTDYANFEDFPTSVLVLFRLSTGDMWELVMYGTTINESNSDCTNSAGNCGFDWAPLYFVLFMIFAGLVLINLFVAIVLENFSYQMASRTEKGHLESVSAWRNSWSYFDRHNSGKIPINNFVAVVLAAPSPFGVHEPPKSVAKGVNAGLVDAHGFLIHNRTKKNIRDDIDYYRIFHKVRWRNLLHHLEVLRTPIYRVGKKWQVQYKDMINSVARLIFRINENVYDDVTEPAGTNAHWSIYEWYAAKIICDWYCKWKKKKKHRCKATDKKVKLTIKPRDELKTPVDTPLAGSNSANFANSSGITPLNSTRGVRDGKSPSVLLVAKISPTYEDEKKKPVRSLGAAKSLQSDLHGSTAV